VFLIEVETFSPNVLMIGHKEKKGQHFFISKNCGSRYLEKYTAG